jgi:hypothetical protein
MHHGRCASASAAAPIGSAHGRNMKKSVVSAAALAVVVSGFAAPARAATIGLCNTGQTADCSAVLSDLALDPNYTIIAGPAGFTGDAKVVLSSGFPIPPWVGNDANSKWITPAAASDHGDDGRPANPFAPIYTYLTTFDLSGFNLSTVRINGLWGTDDLGLDIRINGLSTGQTSGGFATLVPFSITSGFISGVNTLAFDLSNTGGNWTGLRVDDIMATGDPIPEPGTIALFGTGLLGLVARYRQRRQLA